eukprot:TRINITY_DN29823_c0_g1_i1.p1 TRINITY_DN29823_c0_g1~~TRINITY_DN29823_c0_g1_i1.p1  ORF type:complete len:769 (+),score=173.72 TRINITY_DN29823_c0_g1_i1:64-2307(+)
MPSQPLPSMFLRQGVAVDPSRKDLKLSYYVDEPPGSAVLSVQGKSIWAAARVDDVDTVAAVIVGGADVEVQEPTGRSGRPLHHASQAPTPAAAKFLLQRGADINGRDSGGRTPLMWCVEKLEPNGSREMVEVLLNSGADRALRDNDGRSAIDYASAKPVVACWLASRGVPFSAAEPSGRSTLHWAAADGHRLGVQWMLDRNAEAVPVSAPDAEGLTALHLAANGGHYSTAQVLLRGGADCNALDKAGRKPEQMPQCTGALRRLISRYRHGSPADQRKATELDFSNLENLLLPGRMQTFLFAFFVPNWLVVFGAALPAVFGFGIIAGVLYFVQHVVQRGIKNKTPDPGLAGWYIGALVHGTVVLTHQVFLDLTAPRVKLVWGVTTAIMFGCYLSALVADPGTVRSTAEDREQIYSLIERGMEHISKHPYCLTTLVRKPLRAKFCSTTGKVVHRFDHYCVWTCNAIGSGNHRPFYFFTLMQIIAQSMVLWSAHHAIFTLSWEAHPNEVAAISRQDVCSWLDWYFLPSHRIISVMLYLYNLSYMIFVGVVFYQQTGFINRNMTSNEVWFTDRYPWCFRLEKQAYCRYDRGMLYNWKEFLFGNLACADSSLPSVDDNPHLRGVLQKHNAERRKKGLGPIWIADESAATDRQAMTMNDTTEGALLGALGPDAGQGVSSWAAGLLRQRPPTAAPAPKLDQPPVVRPPDSDGFVLTPALTEDTSEAVPTGSVPGRPQGSTARSRSGVRRYDGDS